MIRIQYHPELVEQSVWHAVRCDAVTENSLHSVVDPLYELPKCEDRETLFRKAFVAWFTRLKLDRFLDELLTHFPRIVERVEEGVVRTAPKRKSEGAELFVRHDADTPRQTLVIQLCPESIVDPGASRDAMLRELQHVEDMLDEAFGYVPESIDGLPSQQQVVRDRYRILWDVRVEAALLSRDLLARHGESHLRSRFQRAFTIAGKEPQPGLFDQVLEREATTHAQLMECAKNPREWLPGSTGQPFADSYASPGAPCPICRFPTYDWYASTTPWDDDVLSSIRESAPEWTPDDGICRQCAETFQSLATQQTCGWRGDGVVRR